MTKNIRYIFISGLILRLAYLSYTPFNIREHDVYEHLAYIEYVAKNNSLPLPDYCMECWEQPLYYFISAVVYKIIYFLRVSDWYFLIMQIFSLILYTAFLFFGILIFRLFMDRQSLIEIATAVLVFWPSGVMHSVRITNDVLYYLLFTIGLYYLICWWRLRRTRYIVISSFFVFLTLLTKLNGVILVATVLFSFLYRVFLDRKSSKLSSMPYLKQGVLSLIVITAGLTIAITRSINSGPSLSRWIIGSSNLINENRIMKNTLNLYLSFDIGEFIRQPFVEIYRMPYLFWNYWFKTVLFSEFAFKNPIQIWLARFMNVLLIAFMGFLILGLLKLDFREFKKYFVLIILSFLSLIAAIFVHVEIPMSSSAEFRYVLPILIPMGIFFSLVVDRVNKYLPRISFVGKTLVSLFVVSSYVFFIVPLVY